MGKEYPMDHFQKIAGHLEQYELDAMLLTGEANRYYASGFHSSGTDGVALVTRKGNYYFTDSRYTEAAGRVIQNAHLKEVGRGRGYAALINEVIEADGVVRMGFEDAYMTVQDYERYRKALNCELVPATDLLWELRVVKDEEELRRVVELVIASNPQSVADYRNGKEKAIGFLVGQTMKAMQGKANPGSVNALLKELL